jgi:hypothetical protein
MYERNTDWRFPLRARTSIIDPPSASNLRPFSFSKVGIPTEHALLQPALERPGGDQAQARQKPGLPFHGISGKVFA